MRFHPPTFDSAEDDPLLVDDWLCTITNKLNAVRATDGEKVILATHQLVVTASEWWENYQEAANELEAIIWQEFVEKFHEYHIPEGILEIKAEEFHSLRQGPMTLNQYIWKFMKLARYAPDDINTDKKKPRCFRKGLNAALREQIITHIYPDFNTLMNRTILLEEERNRSKGERKRKFLIQQAHQQERTASPHQQHRTNKISANQAVLVIQIQHLADHIQLQ